MVTVNQLIERLQAMTSEDPSIGTLPVRLFSGDSSDEYTCYWSDPEPEVTVEENIPCRMLEISTAGWSGNESLIASLKTNFIFWHTCWFQTRVGGTTPFASRLSRPMIRLRRHER